MQVEDYSQQLGLRAKELEANPRGEELLHPPRYSSSSLFPPAFKGGESPRESTIQCLQAPTFWAIRISSGT
jgi:hypothetical protein